MDKEPIFSFVKRRLLSARGQFRVIAERTSVPYSTLVKIHQGVIENPGVIHIQTLHDYFNELDVSAAEAMVEKAVDRQPEATSTQ